MDTLIKYETALLAREFGFNDKCPRTYLNRKNGVYVYKPRPNETDDWDRLSSNNDKWFKHETFGKQDCTAPTQSHLQKWFRETHDIHVQVYLFDIVKKIYRGKITYFRNGEHNQYCCFSTVYEDVLEENLVKAFKILKNDDKKTTTTRVTEIG